MFKRTSSDPPVFQPHWMRSIFWLLFLGPFFFLSYGFANQLAVAREVSTSLYFEWERQTPFIPWTIVPYWSIDLLYGLSFLCCRTKHDVDWHGLRLMTAQIIGVACFLIFPLRFAFVHPQVEGGWGLLFDVLNSFDQPYNQAPSLHIALLVLIWNQFSRLDVSTLMRCIIHAWALLIAVSVLTTWQHHCFDVPTGVALGLFCLWLWPDEVSTPLRKYKSIDPYRYKIAVFYSLGAIALLRVATLGEVSGWILGWISIALALVAWNYAWAGAVGFQKQGGKLSLASACLFAPYTLCAWINSRLWTRGDPHAVQIADDVWLGRFPTVADMRRYGFAGLCDLTSEFSAPKGSWRYVNIPLLDLVTPAAHQLLFAAKSIEGLKGQGPVLVACALGYSRSASAVAVWLFQSRRCGSMDEAIQHIKKQSPNVAINQSLRAVLAEVARNE